jgi:type I restriction enzyme R subunit
MDDYKIIVEQEHQTVMAHYDVQQRPSEGYQSEAQLSQREKQYEYYRNKLLTFE